MERKEMECMVRKRIRDRMQEWSKSTCESVVHSLRSHFKTSASKMGLRREE